MSNKPKPGDVEPKGKGEGKCEVGLPGLNGPGEGRDAAPY